MNVVETICREAGISSESLARKLNLPQAAVADAMGNPVAFQILSAFGVHVRVELAELEIRVAHAGVDRLLTDNAWRMSAGLAPYPNTRAELRSHMTILRDAGNSYQEIADHLFANFIPTSDGLRAWRRTNVGQYLASKNDGPLIAGPEVLNAFRPHAVQELIAAACWFSPRAPMLFEIEPIIGQDGARIVSRKPMPRFMVRWMVEEVSALDWFTTAEWGTHGEEDQATGKAA